MTATGWMCDNFKITAGSNELQSPRNSPYILLHFLLPISILSSTDVKNINLQRKKHKNMFFHFYKKTCKNIFKNTEPHLAQ